MYCKFNVNLEIWLLHFVLLSILLCSTYLLHLWLDWWVMLLYQNLHCLVRPLQDTRRKSFELKASVEMLWHLPNSWTFMPINLTSDHDSRASVNRNPAKYELKTFSFKINFSHHCYSKFSHTNWYMKKESSDYYMMTCNSVNYSCVKRKLILTILRHTVQSSKNTDAFVWLSLIFSSWWYASLCTVYILCMQNNRVMT